MILTKMEVRRPEGADGADLTGLTTAKRKGSAYWQDGALNTLVLPFVTEPTAAEQTKIRRRLATVDAADEARLESLLAQKKALTGAEPALTVMWLNDQLAQYGET